MRNILLIFLLTALVQLQLYGQCGPGQTEMIIEVDGTVGSFNEEISWQLYNHDTDTLVTQRVVGFLGSGAVEIDSLCLEDGVNYRFEAYDGFGDSWNGATYSILYSDNFVLRSSMPDNGTEAGGSEDLEEQFIFKVGDRPGDDCILPKTVSTGQIVSVSTDLYSNNYQSDPLFDSGREAIFSFSPTTTEEYAITFADISSLDRGSIQLFDACYDSAPTRLAFDSTGVTNNLLEIFQTLNAGSTYFIVVSNNSIDTGIDFISGNLSVSYSGLPVNVSCPNAYNLTLDGDSVFSRTTNVAPAQNPVVSVETEYGDFRTAEGDSLFYDFTLASQESIVIEIGDYENIYPVFIELEKLENCGEEPESTFTRLAREDVSKVFAFSDLLAGTYRLKVFPPAFLEDEFYVKVQSQASKGVASNQNCTNALNLDVFGYQESSTATSISYFNSLDSGIGAPCGQDSIYTAGTGDVWVKAFVPNSGDLVVETFGELYDVFSSPDSALETRFAIYTGSCGSLTELYCSDQFAAHQTDTIRGLPANEEFFVRLWDRNGGNSGLMNIRLSEPQPLPFPNVSVAQFPDSLHFTFTNGTIDNEFFYEVQISEDSFNTFLPAFNPATISSFSGDFGVPGLQPASKYYIRIFSTNGILTNSDTSVFEVQTSPYFISTEAPGNWSDPATWSSGTVPPADSAVNIYHKVSINTGENFTVNTVNIVGNFEATASTGLWIENGNLTVENDILVSDQQGAQLGDSVGVFIYTDPSNSASLNVGRDIRIDKNDNFSATPLRFEAINNGDSLLINVGGGMSLRQLSSDSTTFTGNNFNIQNATLDIQGDLLFLNDRSSSPQPYTANIFNSFVHAGSVQVDEPQNTNGDFQINFTGNTDLLVDFSFMRNGAGGKINFEDQSSLYLVGIGYQQISGFGIGQDSIIYNNLILNMEDEIASDGNTRAEISASASEFRTQLYIEGNLEFINGLLRGYNMISGNIREVVLGASGTATNFNDISYVQGPVVKIGNTPFVYPVGTEVGLRSIGILNNDEFQPTDFVRVDPVDNACGDFDSGLNASGLARDRFEDYWEVTSGLADSAVSASFEPIFSNPIDAGITDPTALALVDFYDGTSLGNLSSTDSSFISGVEYFFGVSDTARLGIASLVESENPFYYRKEILDYSQNSGFPGESITLNLSGDFGGLISEVYFGGKTTPVGSNTGNSVTVTVPFGAQSGSLKAVGSDGKIFYSRRNFTVGASSPIPSLDGSYDSLTLVRNITDSALLGASTLQLGLINGDNKVDAIIAIDGYDSIAYFNDLEGVFSYEPFALNVEGIQLSPTDIDLDLSNITSSAVYDFVLSFRYQSINSIIYYQNDGNGNYTNFGDAADDANITYNDFDLRDFDFDGFTDILYPVADLTSGSTQLVFNSFNSNKDCSPYGQAPTSLETAGSQEVTDVIPVFFTGIQEDVLLTSMDLDSGYLINSDIYATSNTVFNGSIAPGEIYESIKISLNGDGLDQIMSSNFVNNQLRVFDGSSYSTINVSFAPANLFAEDMDGDGFQDLVATDYNNASVHILLNDGAGNLIEAHSYSYAGARISDLAVVDLDGDEAKDIVMLRENGDFSVAYFNLPAPINPPIISASNISTSSFDLSWDSLANATSYEIFVSLENDTIADLSTDSTFVLGDTALSFNAPLPFETYYVFGRSISSTGDTSNYSASVPVSLLNLDALNIQSQNISTSGFDLFWNGIDNASQYEILITLEDDTTGNLESDSTFVLGDTTLSFNAPFPFDSYYVFGRSISAEGDTSTFSNSLLVNLLSLDSMNIQAQNIGTSSFDLSWNAVNNAAEYELFISLENDTIADLASDSIFILSDSVLSFEAASAFDTYYVFGRSISSAGDTSSYSVSIAVDLLSLDSMAIQSQNVGVSSFDLNWQGISNAVEYQIFVSLENNTTADLATDSSFVLSDTALSFSAPIPFETYYVFGRSISADGDTSSYSQSVSVQLNPLGTPASLVSTNITSISMDLSWDVVEGADEYQVYVGTDDSATVIGVNDSLFTVSSENISYLAPEYSELYFFKVRAIASSGDTSNYSATGNIQLPVSNHLQQDSAAMVALYQSTNGSNWLGAENWLTGKLNTWEGLIMTKDSLKSISLPSNQLEGILPTEMGDLNFVNSIDFADNDLTDISSLAPIINSINTFDVSDNQLSFEQLEGFNLISNFSYSNQSFNYNLPSEFLEFLSADISIDITAPASSNTFQWYKDNELLSGATGSSLVINNLERADEGLYYVEIRNDLLADLVLTSTVTELKVSSLERDVSALREFYESTNGADWGPISWDTSSNDPREWSSDSQDIVVEDDRVVEINLPENNLSGSIPEVLNEVLGLRSIDVSSNAIGDLANLSSLPNLSLLDVSENSLDYLDIEENITVAGFEFNDQANFGVGSVERLPQGSEYLFEYDIVGTSNSYEWYRNDVLISTTDSAFIVIDSLTFDKMGEYTVEVRNDIVAAVDPDFRLVSNPVQLIATTTINGIVKDANDFPTERGRMYLFAVMEDGEYDSVRFSNGEFFINLQEDGVFTVDNVDLGNYLCYIRNDQNEYPNLLNTYFPNTIDWELADIVSLRRNSEEIEIIMEGEPQELNGTSSFSGFLDEEFEEEERLLPRRRVSGAGVSVRRLSASTRNLSFIELLLNGELVAYLETDENGEFDIPNLPAGRYTVKFDIPGVPMNENSDINFELTGEDQETLEISALIDGGQISVSRVSYTANKSTLFADVTVYPNPSTGEFNIVGIKEVANVKIISSDGRLVQKNSDFSSIADEMKVDISEYPAGLYFLQITWKDGFRSVNKLIKE